MIYECLNIRGERLGLSNIRLLTTCWLNFSFKEVGCVESVLKVAKGEFSGSWSKKTYLLY